MPYKPINTDKQFNLVEPTFGTYKAMKMAMLNCTAVDASNKAQILREFNINRTDSQQNPQDIFGVEGLQLKYFKLLFIEAKLDEYKDVKADDLNMNQINKAATDFFYLASGGSLASGKS